MTTPPDSACIINALQRAPGVSEVSEMHRSSQGIVIIGNGPKQGSTIDYYMYRVGPSRMQQAVLTIEQFPAGHYRYSDEMLSMHQRIPYAQIAIALPVMDTAMHNIAAACNITALRELRHSCNGYKCPT